MGGSIISDPVRFFNQHLLKAYYVPDTFFKSTRFSRKKKTKKEILVLMEPTFERTERDNKDSKRINYIVNKRRGQQVSGGERGSGSCK